jgi:hypothetical protein
MTKYGGSIQNIFAQYLTTYGNSTVYSIYFSNMYMTKYGGRIQYIFVQYVTEYMGQCSLSSRRGLVQEYKRMALEYAHGLFIT